MWCAYRSSKNTTVNILPSSPLFLPQNLDDFVIVQHLHPVVPGDPCPCNLRVGREKGRDGREKGREGEGRACHHPHHTTTITTSIQSQSPLPRAQYAKPVASPCQSFLPDSSAAGRRTPCQEASRSIRLYRSFHRAECNP